MVRRKDMMAWEEGNKDEEEKWVKHYSSFQQILLVGEGDFSFSLALAISFHSAANMVATSLDSYVALGFLRASCPAFIRTSNRSELFVPYVLFEVLLFGVLTTKYGKAKSNLEHLKKMGATLLHGIDATQMKFHTDLKARKFDRIIFNFPHVGFKGKEDDMQLINMHKKLVYGFFKNATHMLRQDGEVHISHKTSFPFSEWKLEDLATANSLVLLKCVDFKIEDYAGYNNKRGDGPRCDQPFPLGECCTFMFRIGKCHRRKSAGADVTGLCRPVIQVERRPIYESIATEVLSPLDTMRPHYHSLGGSQSHFSTAALDDIVRDVNQMPNPLKMRVSFSNFVHNPPIGRPHRGAEMTPLDTDHLGYASAWRNGDNSSALCLRTRHLDRDNSSTVCLRTRQLEYVTCMDRTPLASAENIYTRHRMVRTEVIGELEASLRTRFEAYRNASGNSVRGYSAYLEDLHRSSIERTARLRRMLLHFGQAPPQIQ